MKKDGFETEGGGFIQLPSLLDMPRGRIVYRLGL